MRSALALAVLLVPALDAHDDARAKLSRQAPAATPVMLGADDALDAAFPSSGVTLLSWLPLSAFPFGSTRGADSWGYTSSSGREYAILGMSNAVAFVEITDPGMPVVVETFSAVESDWRDIKIYEDHAYYVSEGGDGVQIVDLSQIDAGIVTHQGFVNSNGTTSSHNVAIDTDSGFLYQLGGGSSTVEGLRIYSLANKSNPTFVGEWDDRYIHDAQVVTYTSGPWADKQVAFCFSESSSGGGSPGVDILDVTNKNNIQSLSLLTYSSPVFSHQGWLSPDRQHLYINDELDEINFGTNTTTRVIDVSDLTDPDQVGTFGAGLPSIDHNLYTKDNLIYEANYRSGLRVFDATDPVNPTETAYFDTYSSDDGASFNGLWNVFPYYDSGTLIGSDIEKGLFMWRLGAPEIAFDHTPAELTSPFGDTLSVTITTSGATLLPGSPTLHLDTGTGFVPYTLANVGGNTWQTSVPPLPCNTELAYHISARTTAGVTYHEPAGAPTYLYGSTVATSAQTVLMQDMESDPGWVVGVGSDDATTGIWTRVNPIGTAAQPEDDHTDPPGTDCWVTGQGSLGGSLGDDDVDDGKTTLRTHVFDLSGGDATIRYWRWYSNNTGSSAGNDVFEISISNSGGGNWVTVETVGPNNSQTVGGWFQHSFLVSDFVTPTADMRMRFVASDEGDGSIVEAAIDDFEVLRFDCTEVCQDDLGFTGPGSAMFAVCGEPLDTGNSATLTLSQAAPNAPAVLFLSIVNNPSAFKGGTLVTVPILLGVSLFTDGTGSISLPVTGGGGPATLFGQIAIADAAQIKGVALSNAVELVFGP